MNYCNFTALVVDDFASMRRIVVALLREAGFIHIAEAEDGASALRKLESGKFQLVVSDWNMPNMSGLELLKTVRQSPDLAQIPFLLVTAEARKENIVEAAKAGADGYIVKPFTSVTLSEKVDAVLRRKGVA